MGTHLLIDSLPAKGEEVAEVRDGLGRLFLNILDGLSRLLLEPLKGCEPPRVFRRPFYLTPATMAGAICP